MDGFPVVGENDEIVHGETRAVVFGPFVGEVMEVIVWGCMLWSTILRRRCWRKW